MSNGGAMRFGTFCISDIVVIIIRCANEMVITGKQTVFIEENKTRKKASMIL